MTSVLPPPGATTRLRYAPPASAADRAGSPDGGPKRAKASGAAVARALLGALLAALAGAAFAPAFGRSALDALTDLRFSLPVGGMVAAVAVIGILLGAGTRFAPVSRLSIELAVLAAFVLLVVAPGRVILDGPRRLLSSALPLEPAGAELATVVAVVGLAAIGAVEPALRRRSPLLPALAPLLAVIAGVAASASAGPPPSWLATAFGLVCVGLLLIGRYAGPKPSTVDGPSTGATRRLIGGGVVVVLAAAVITATVAGPVLLDRTGRTEPADARRLVPQPVQPRTGTSPLVLFPALRTGKLRLNLTVEAAQRPDRMRYATLDRFDGMYWSTDARYLRAARRLPLDENRPDDELRTERVTVDRAGPFGWLVSSGRPTEVSVSDLGVDETTGDVVLPADRPIPTGYTVHSAVPQLTENALRAATPAAATGHDEPVPVDLATRATEITGSAEFGYPALQELANYFSHGEFAEDVTADPPSGHGLFQIRRLMTDKRGTAEQYASAFAVLARALGYDTRVVVGFTPRPDRNNPGTYRVTGQDVHAWAEVRFRELGWVPLDPTPGKTTDKDPDEEQNQTSPSPSPSPSQQASAPANQPSAGQSAGAAAPPGRSVTGTGVVVLVLLVGLFALVVAAVPVAKSARRRKRRRAPDPNRRTASAWQDTLDRLRESGLSLAGADTAGEVGTATHSRFGTGAGDSVARLASIYDAAIYGAEPVPGSVADTAWRHADAARRSVRAALPKLRRLRAALNPRPLLRRSR